MHSVWLIVVYSQYSSWLSGTRSFRSGRSEPGDRSIITKRRLSFFFLHGRTDFSHIINLIARYWTDPPLRRRTRLPRYFIIDCRGRRVCTRDLRACVSTVQCPRCSYGSCAPDCCTKISTRPHDDEITPINPRATTSLKPSNTHIQRPSVPEEFGSSCSTDNHCPEHQTYPRLIRERRYWRYTSFIMKIWTVQHTFNYPWETVVQAAWNKYPNPMNTAVLGIDVIDRQVINGELHSHRLVTTRWTLPNWACALMGPISTFYASEYSKVNRDRRQLKLDSRNLSLGPFVVVREKLTYKPHPDDPQKTLLKQTAYVTVEGLPCSGYIENILTNKISGNAAKGRQAIEWVIEKLQHKQPL